MDDDDEEDSPLLYIGQHRNQLYIQESLVMEKEADGVQVMTMMMMMTM